MGVQDASEDGSEIGVFQVRPRALVRLVAPQHLEDSRVWLRVFSQRGVPVRRVSISVSSSDIRFGYSIRIFDSDSFCLFRAWE